MGNALALEGYEGRGKLRKASGSCNRTVIRRCPNGETFTLEERDLNVKPPELKHLSRERKRK